MSIVLTGPSGTPRSAPSARPSRFFRLLLRHVLQPLLALRYRITVEGLEALRAADDGRGVLFLPSHSALVDPLLLYSLLPDYLPRPLADTRQVDVPVVRSFVRLLRPIVIPDPKAHRREALPKIRVALQAAAAALNHGDSLLLYPAGRLTRDGMEHLGANSGAHAVISAAPLCRIVLVRIRGLWGSRFSAARCGQGQTPLFFRVLLESFGKLMLNGLFFMPRRHVRVTFTEVPQDALPQTESGPLALNRWLEDFYQAEPQPLTRVPDLFWRTE